MKNRAPPPPAGIAPLRVSRPPRAGPASLDGDGTIPSEKAAALSSDKSDTAAAAAGSSATLPTTKAGSPPLTKGGTLPSRGKAAAPKPPLVARGQNVPCSELEFSVILPSGQLHSASSEKRIPIMDVLVRLCAWYRLSPARHALELYSRVDGRLLPFKPNMAIGSLPVGAVRLVEKDMLDARRARRSNAPEPTVRLVVNSSRTQKVFLRVSPRVPLRVLLPAIGAKSGLQARSLLLFRDASQAERVDPARSLNEVGVRELYVVDTSKAIAQCHPIVHGSHTYPGAHRQPPPPPGITEDAGKENAGLFSCLRPRKKKLVPRSLPASPAPVPAAAAAPRRPTPASDPLKKRRAPAPPVVAAATLPRAAPSARPAAPPGQTERPRSHSLPGADTAALGAGGADADADAGGAKKKKRAAPQPQGHPQARPKVEQQPQGQPQARVQLTEQPPVQPKVQAQPKPPDQCHGQPKERAHPRKQLVIVSGLEVTVVRDSHAEKRGRCDGEACGEAGSPRCRDGERGADEIAGAAAVAVAAAEGGGGGGAERPVGGGYGAGTRADDAGAGAGGDAVPVRAAPGSPERGPGHTVTWADVKAAEVVSALPYIDSGYEQEAPTEALPGVSAQVPDAEDGATGAAGVGAHVTSSVPLLTIQ